VRDAFCTQVNCVVMRGINEEELIDFVQLTEHKVQFGYPPGIKDRLCDMT